MKIENPNIIISSFKDALSDKLKDLALIFPEIENVFEKNLMWAIFSKDEIDSKNKNSALTFSYPLITQTQNSIKEQYPEYSDYPLFHSDVIAQIENKEIQVIYGKNFSDDLDLEVEINEAKDVKNTINDKIFVSMTTPDSDILFESLIIGNLFDDANHWLLEHMDTYDAWSHELMRTLRRNYIQIGGHGRWIQSDYNGTYIAQVNADIGDAGSIYVYCGKDKILANVDMF